MKKRNYLIIIYIGAHVYHKIRNKEDVKSENLIFNNGRMSFIFILIMLVLIYPLCCIKNAFKSFRHYISDQITYFFKLFLGWFFLLFLSIKGFHRRINWLSHFLYLVSDYLLVWPPFCIKRFLCRSEPFG